MPEDEEGARQVHGLVQVLSNATLTPAFIVQLLQRLRDLRPHVRPAYEWLEQVLADRSMSAAEIVMAEHQGQAAASATVRNIITSMRLISSFDWSAFFERVSLVDAAMRGAQRLRGDGVRVARRLPPRHRGAGSRQRS
jgi:cyclic beta-1,2-glucan synthetase